MYVDSNLGMLIAAKETGMSCLFHLMCQRYIGFLKSPDTLLWRLTDLTFCTHVRVILNFHINTFNSKNTLKTNYGFLNLGISMCIDFQ